MTRRDDPIWEEEVVEIFLDPARLGRHYAEVEISPAERPDRPAHPRAVPRT